MAETAADTALIHYRQQQTTVRKTAAAAQTIWRTVDAAALDDSWRAAGPLLVRAMADGQRSAAAPADAYVAAAITADGGTPDPAGRVSTEAFVGRAADGRSLTGLLYEPWIETRWRLAAGQTRPEAMRGGMATLIRQVGTEIPDAGRGATGVSMAGDRAVSGYVRVLTPPSCARCVILAGRRYKYSAGFQRHPLCFPAGVVVSGPASQAASRRWFDGELVVLSTASGQKLSLTGNHPVLTGRGWIPANLLQEGDEVVRSTRPEGATPLVVPDHHQVPSLIEDVWGALGVHGLDRMPAAPEDFHGDGQKGQVDVVYADSALRDRCMAPVSKKAAQLGLSVGLGVSGELAIERAAMFVDLRDAAHASGAVRPGGLGLPFSGAHLLGADDACLAAVARLDSGLRQASPDDISGHAVLPSEGVLAGAFEVGGDYLVHGEVASLSRWDAPGAAFGVETREGYASRGRDLLERLSGQIELDRIVELRRVEWSGHVYSLTSAEGWHVADSLIVSNCDCVHLPVGARHDSHVMIHDPEEYFHGLSRAEQDRVFTIAGAQAIRDGADINSVVNARRGMYTADAYGRRLASTYDGTTKRGAFFRDERRRAIDRGLLPPSGHGFRLTTHRLLPEEIYKQAGSRDELISMLRRYGYIN